MTCSTHLGIRTEDLDTSPEGTIETIFRYYNSFSRLEAVLNCLDYLDHDDWRKVLGECWDSCDNIRDHFHVLRRLLGRRGPVLQMMISAEVEAYWSLPDLVTVYRGCDRSVLTGASWSLDRSVAEGFPFIPRYRALDPVLVTATVPRHRILAIKLGREEEEIITFNARRRKVENAISPFRAVN